MIAFCEFCAVPFLLIATPGGPYKDCHRTWRCPNCPTIIHEFRPQTK